MLNALIVLALTVTVIGGFLPDRVLTTLTPQSQKSFWVWYLCGLVGSVIYAASLWYQVFNPQPYSLF